MNRPRNLIAACCLILSPILPAFGPGPLAQEHPREHPSEHPSEHPAQKAEEPAVSAETLADAITAYVSTDAKLKGGYFLVYDGAVEQPLVLTLEKVHKDKLATLGEGLYFACADFKTPEGKTYDLDVFMKWVGDRLETTEITVHKEEGKARYGWLEKDGVWVREPNE